jgi:hypothetical protein
VHHLLRLSSLVFGCSLYFRAFGHVRDTHFRNTIALNLIVPLRQSRLLTPDMKPLRALLTLATLSACCANPAAAERIDNQVAIFSALDKVTARISRFEAPLGETVKFGSLKITPRVCYSRAATEQPKTTTFVEVEETLLNGQNKRLFTGWMFAESPGLHAVEHPVFDVWLTECKQPTKPAAPAAAGKPGQPLSAAGATPRTDIPSESRPRVRR